MQHERTPTPQEPADRARAAGFALGSRIKPTHAEAEPASEGLGQARGETLPTEVVELRDDRGSDTVSISSLTNETSVRTATQSLDIVRRTLGSVSLDLSSIGRGRRVSPQWGAVLANLLTGQFADISMKVQLPPGDSARLQLARSGLFFAIARHENLDWQSLKGSQDTSLRQWSVDWEPADVQQPLFLFDDETDNPDAPKQIEREFVAFLNPDKLGKLPTVFPRQGGVVFPWLRDMLPVFSENDEVERTKLEVDVSQVIWELLSNVRGHAKVPYRGLCSVSLFITGGRRGDERLNVSVFDTGVGIVDALRTQFRIPPAPAELVALPFNGELPLRARDRGTGLHRITTIVERAGGELFVATGPVDDRGAVLIEHRSGQDRRVEASVNENLSVRGTVIVLSLPLRRFAPGRPPEGGGSR
jgi:hypothetical protein